MVCGPRLTERTVEGMADGGSIDNEAADVGVIKSMLPLGATELRRSAATEDCLDVLPVVERDLGFATGRNIGPPFSKIEGI